MARPKESLSDDAGLGELQDHARRFAGGESWDVPPEVSERFKIVSRLVGDRETIFHAVGDGHAAVGCTGEKEAGKSSKRVVDPLQSGLMADVVLRDGVVPQKTLLSFTDVPKMQTLIPLKSQKRDGYCWRTPINDISIA